MRFVASKSSRPRHESHAETASPSRNARGRRGRPESRRGWWRGIMGHFARCARTGDLPQTGGGRMQQLCYKCARDLRPARAAAERSEKRRTPPHDRVAGSSESFGHFGFLVLGFGRRHAPSLISSARARRAPTRLRLRPRAPEGRSCAAAPRGTPRFHVDTVSEIG